MHTFLSRVAVALRSYITLPKLFIYELDLREFYGKCYNLACIREIETQIRRRPVVLQNCDVELNQFCSWRKFWLMVRA